jgi:hypothetical protein
MGIMAKVQRKNRLSLYFYLLLTFVCLPTFLFSQITVTQSEFLKLFTPGNSLYAVPGESGLINVGKREGPNVYDFSFVGALNEFTMTNYKVGQIPVLSMVIILYFHLIRLPVWRTGEKICL